MPDGHYPGSAASETAHERTDAVAGTGADTERLLRIFCGPNAEPFVRYYEKKYRDRGKRLNFGWCWPAVLCPIPWLFYRRLYRAAIMLILLPVAMGLLLPQWTGVSISAAAIMVFCGLTGKRGYIDHALRRIHEIRMQGGSHEECENRVREAGGVSYLTATVATSFWLVFASLPVLVKHLAA